MDSIKNKILTLPLDTIVFPGHGSETILKNEKENNPFIKEYL
jgi:glyoxylase-like metal-dependent hydrolase (beta-lactamase superfamily II)